MKALTFVVLFLIGCGSDYGSTNFDSTIKLDNLKNWAFTCEFPAELQESFRKGFGYWNQEADVQLFEEGPCVPVGAGVAGILVEYDPSGSLDGDVWAYASDTQNRISVYPSSLGQDDATLQSVARHEIGHALGFAHVLDDHCLMAPTIWEGEGLKGLCPAELNALKGSL